MSEFGVWEERVCVPCVVVWGGGLREGVSICMWFGVRGLLVNGTFVCHLPATLRTWV